MSKKSKFIFGLKKISDDPLILKRKIEFILTISLAFLLLTPFLYLNRLIPKTRRVLFAKFRSDRMGHFSG